MIYARDHYSKTIVKTARMISYKSGHPGILIRFPFAVQTLQQVKTIPGRMYHPEKKYWSCPLSIEAIEELQKFGFSINEDLQAHLQKTKIHINNIKPIEIPGLRGTLRPFQNIGVSFIEQKNGRALIADEMGLGKTIEALAWLQLHPELRPVIIVVPASVKLNWAREAHRWLSSVKTQILSGKSASTKLTGNLIIINYDILSSWLVPLKSLKAKVLIIDECHFIKNNSAKRTKAVKRLGKSIKHVIALSGTPIENRPIEICNAINLIDPNIFSSFWSFAHRYCGAKHNGFGWDFNGSTNTQELHDKLTSTVMIRRLKKDVLTELPELTRSYIPMELDNKKEYYQAKNNFIKYIKINKGKVAAQKASNAQTLTKIETLKQVAVRGKLKQVISWIHDFLDGCDGKLVVFAIHKFVITELINEFGVIAVKIDGSVTGKARQNAVDEFQTNPFIRLSINNIDAGGIGITLTAASDAAITELPWSPGKLNQAESRIHRITQEGSVTIHYLLAADTIEEEIAELLDTKRKVLDAVLDGKDTEQESLLTELINKYT